MFRVRVYGEVNGKDITLIPGRCYKVTYECLGKLFSFDGLFYYSSEGYLVFKNTYDTLFESIRHEKIENIEEV